MRAACAAVPVDVHLPSTSRECTAAQPCPVALLSPGYGMNGREYSFITRELNQMGYLVAALHEPTAGAPKLDPDADRAPQLRALANLGAQKLRTAIEELAPQYPNYDWRQLVLVGHSLGGDSSALFAAQDGAPVTAVVTLDNRRIALPRTPQVRVLTIRAADTTADPGVLLSVDEVARFGACVVTIGGSRHNDMQDAGSPALKAKIAHAIASFLTPAARPAYACDSDSRLE